MKKIIIFISIFIFSVCSIAMSKRAKQYWINKNVTVLAFIGNPNSSSLTPVRFVTYEKQPIVLMHKKSGRGIYAFYLKNLIVKGDYGRRVIEKEGFFVVKKKLLSSSPYWPKQSMKSKTKKGVKDYDEIIYPQF